MVLRRIRVSQAGGSRGWAEEEKQGEQGGHGQGEPGLDEGEQGGGEVAGESGEVAEVDVAAECGADAVDEQLPMHRVPSDQVERHGAAGEGAAVEQHCGAGVAAACVLGDQPGGQRQEGTKPSTPSAPWCSPPTSPAARAPATMSGAGGQAPAGPATGWQWLPSPPAETTSGRALGCVPSPAHQHRTTAPPPTPVRGPLVARPAAPRVTEGLEGKRAHTVALIAAGFGVTRPTIYRHLSKTAALSADPKPPEAGAPIAAAGFA